MCIKKIVINNENSFRHQCIDCAISASVKYVVSNDKHYNILKQIPFPKVEVITIQEFLLELQKPLSLQP
jgi:predicted nucleic acid-binding protein